MALKPLRPCRHAGCAELTRDGWCPKHRPKSRRRDSAAYHSWYSLPIWTDHLRPDHLLQEPFCRECARHGIRRRATDVDHVVPHDGDWAKFTDRGNLQSLCHGCHSAKTMAESRAKSRAKRR